ncbi:uncharacterized protein LOC127103344 [Lathyrus oleraceus]|uniref:C2H2-type domain-containing protein n=1 Tax=Pisum sativum TaxID=3888 RepID=A0A9D4ZZ87_PEA|nr:uncharacterized protein LOC127103344 [Pisum sativum]KAI5387983.1 hypothetical protein KIW84_073899 [Pisum sativum]
MDPSKNTNSTPNNSPPISPSHSPSEHDNTPTETNPIPEAEGSSENVIMKTAEEVWAELTAGDDEIYGNESGDGGNEDDGDQDGDASRSLVIAVTADGVNVPVMGSGGGAGGSGKGSKKRKSNQVRNPPQGTPTCPKCRRQIATWKAAFGHMRKHPECLHRGFFSPPTFEPPQLPAVEGDGGNQVDEEVQHVVRGLVVDLNRSLTTEEGPSAGGGSGGKKRS